MQRVLAVLVQEGRVIAIGKTRSRRYKLSGNSGQSLKAPDPAIPLTPESELIQAQVLLPLQSRFPVGYLREFLEDYRPNIDFYLSAETRQKLLQLGSSHDGAYPAGTYARQILHRLLIDLSFK